MGPYGASNPGYQYQMSGQVLEATEEERDIGVMISANLIGSQRFASCHQKLLPLGYGKQRKTFQESGMLVDSIRRCNEEN
jgi:hypothetical protein